MARVSTSISLDSDVKRQAQELFSDLGLDLSTAINIFLKQSIRDEGFPFEICRETPNAVTRAAIDAANIGDTNRRILRMRYLDGRCFSYIAAELGFSESQIYRRHKAAMVILAAVLREDET